MKKSLSLLLVLALVFSMFASVAMAAEGTNAGEVLKNLGVIQGSDNGDLMEDSNWKRQDVAVLISRLLGQEPEAKATAKSHTFADVKGTFYDGYLSWAAENKFMEGNSATDFGWDKPITVKQFLAVVLRVLGFDTTGENFAKVEEYAVATGLIEEGADLSVEAKRGDTYKYVVTALDTEVGGVKLGTKLGLPGYEVTAQALDLSSAVAINSKVVELSLGTAATAADVAAASVTVKDDAGAEVAVSSVAVAPWATDGKAVLVTLGADTASGKLYTATVGGKTANFGGKAADTAKPTVTSVTSTDYNLVEVQFNEAVLLSGGSIVLAEKYGSKAALDVTATAYSGRDKLVLTTGEQKEATLYGAAIQGFADLAGNTMDKDEAKTFTGTKKDTSDLKVDAAGANNPEEVVVGFNVNVDPATVKAENFKVEEMYGSKATLAVSDARLATKDDLNTVAAALTDVTAKKFVILTVPGTKDATLYKVTASNLVSLYGKAQSSTDADKSKTFTGKSKPTDPFTYTVNSGIATSNTVVELTFANKVVKEDAENVANYAIAEAYGDKAAVTVSKAELQGNGKTVKLTVSALKTVLYKITITNVKDVWGNSIKTADSANVVSFSGKAVADKISAINSIAYNGTSVTQIIVTFNQNVGNSVTDVAHYTIDNGVGYPEKAEKVDGQAAQVKLTLPKLTEKKVYKLTVKGLENADGIAMDSNGVSGDFVGKGNAATNPELVGVVAVDNQTIKVYFDREVTDSSIAGQIWDKDNNVLITAALSYVHNANVTTDLASLVEYAYQDPSNKNVLVVRIDTNDAFKADNKDATLGQFKLVGASAKFAANKNELIFSPIEGEPANIKIDGVSSLNKRTIRVYFNQPVYFGTASNVFDINTTNVVYGSGTPITVVGTPVAVDGTNRIYDFNLSADLSNATFWLNINAAAKAVNVDIKDKSIAGAGYVAIDGQQNNLDFAGSSASVTDIKDIQVVMTDAKTITVYFPTKMNATGAFGSNGAASASVLDADNYNILNGAATPVAVTMNDDNAFDAATHIANIEYKSEGNENKVIITLNQKIKTAANGAFLYLDQAIANAVGNANVKDGANQIKQQFAIGTADAAKVTIASATYDAAAGTIKIKLNQRAYAGATINSGATLLSNIDITMTVGGTSTALVAGNITGVTTVGTTAGAAVDEIVVTLDNAFQSTLTEAGVGKVSFKGATALTGINGEADKDDSSVTFSH